MARPRKYVRDEVIRAAERQFRITGYNGTTVDDLASATGLGRGSLYAAFGDKHGLFVEAVEAYFTRLERSAGQTLAGPDEGALERLRQFLLGAVRGIPLGCEETSVEDRAATACLSAKAALELGTSDLEAARRVSAGGEFVRAAVADCVRAAQRHGDLDPDADPDELAWLMLAVVRGMDVIGAAGSDPLRLAAIAELAFASLPLRNDSGGHTPPSGPDRPERFPPAAKGAS